MTDLDKLIEAVERGCARNTHFDAIDGAGHYSNAIHAYHGSLDAAKALHEALLPDHWISEMRSKCGPKGENFYVSIAKVVGRENHAWDGVSEVHARAWLISIIKAYRAQVVK